MSLRNSFPVKVMIYDAKNKKLYPLIPAVYSTGQPLEEFIKEIGYELFQTSNPETIKFYTNLDDDIITSISDTPLSDVYYHMLVVLNEGDNKNKEQFLQNLPRGIQQRICFFLTPYPPNILETSVGIFSISGENLCTDPSASYKGIASFKEIKNGILLIYYTENDIDGFKIIVNGKNPVDIQTLDMKFYTDIASRFEDFKFNKIASAVQWDKYILVEHIKASKHGLKTFAPLDNKCSYRDTGNRILRMNIIEDYATFGLKPSFRIVKRMEIKETLKYTKTLIEHIERQLNGKLCAIANIGTNENYIFTWHEKEKESRIYHSCTEKMLPEKPIVRFQALNIPNSLVYLKTINVFLLSFSDDSGLYLIEPYKEVNPKLVEGIFTVTDESFDAFGEIKDMRSLFINDKEIITLLQRGRITIYFIKDILNG